MPDPSQLPHLLDLLSDDDPRVHTAVLEHLASFGDKLAHHLESLPEPLDDARIRQIRDIVDRHVDDCAPVIEEPAAPFERQVRLRPGQIVRHRRYGYRGLVVEVDLSCQASQDWYLSNRTRPPRNQPWYHVLVHGSSSVTYAAQTSLRAEMSAKPVQHPLVRQFFGEYDGTRYKRNDRPWPDGARP